ncbi:MAG: hypothetical protein JW946_04260, partial [Candidatus Omnitrophica bacterium]|nr:hypothetical protein [Candidatus Omnitrophota bacterium]
IHNPYIIFSLIMISAGILISIFIYMNKYKEKILKPVVFSLIIVDLYVYGSYGSGFTNMASLNYIQRPSAEILNVLKSDNSFFRIMPFDLLDNNMPQWVKPNANMLYNIDSIAAYTPLVNSNYKSELSPLEVVDDSLGFLHPAAGALAEKYQALRLLNVKYIISAKRIDAGFLKNVTSNGNIFIYEVSDYLPRIFFTINIDSIISVSPAEYFKIIEYKDGFAKVELKTGTEGFLVLSENYFAGWSAYVDGVKTKPMLVKNLIQAVKLEKGPHAVIFKYNPVYYTGKK